jgi:hypothetical protein
MQNYYCRMLSRDYFVRTVTEEQYEKARAALHQFDYCTVIENSEWIQLLAGSLRWKPVALRKNTSKPRFRRFLGYLKRGKPHLAARQLLHPPPPRSHFIEWFKKKNFFDYQLYREAVQRHNELVPET